MSKPSSEAENKLATEQPAVPRYVIVRTFGGYDFAPDTKGPDFEITPANDRYAAKRAARNRAEAGPSNDTFVLLLVLLSVGSAALAEIAIQAAAFIR